MQSADRGFAILAAFSDRRPELGVSELARELGLHKSTVSRLLGTLEGRGLVRRVGERFVPGPELVRLGSLASRDVALLPLARPILSRLAEDTGETVNLAVRQGDAVLNVHQVETVHFVGLTDWTGRTTPLHATANGKALLAFGDDPVPRALPALTERTIVGRRALEEELERTRERGYARAVEELESGLISVAAPVFDWRRSCVAAVSVAGPSYRVPVSRLSRLGPACASAAFEISRALGHREAA
jgi:DNA-binding IclR family transcriptional regulator